MWREGYHDYVATSFLLTLTMSLARLTTVSAWELARTLPDRHYANISVAPILRISTMH